MQDVSSYLPLPSLPKERKFRKWMIMASSPVFHFICYVSHRFNFPTEYLYAPQQLHNIYSLYVYCTSYTVHYVHTYTHSYTTFATLPRAIQQTVSSEVSRKLQFIIYCLVFRTRCLTQDDGNDGDDDTDEEKKYIFMYEVLSIIPPARILLVCMKHTSLAKVIRH